MSNLQSALSRIGEVAPERPLPEPVEGGNECDMTNSFANRLGLHVTALESLVLRLAERVEKAERAILTVRRSASDIDAALLILDPFDLTAVGCCHGPGKKKRVADDGRPDPDPTF